MEEFKGQNILNLVKELPDDEACKAYLSKIKWLVLNAQNVGLKKAVKNLVLIIIVTLAIMLKVPLQTLYFIK